MAHAHAPAGGNLDPNKKLALVRDTRSIPHFDAQAAQQRKVINIPICETSLDADYEKNVAPTFVLPSSYLRYVRRIGDETDVTIDYNMEQEDRDWLATRSRLSNDKEASKHLTTEAFEAIINILERHTGLSRDPLPQVRVTRALAVCLVFYVVLYVVCVCVRVCVCVCACVFIYMCEINNIYSQRYCFWSFLCVFARVCACSVLFILSLSLSHTHTHTHTLLDARRSPCVRVAQMESRHNCKDCS